jgi:2-polyprenyl-3-methyl-5-hydroxy-6-metoxy-1,4-benzoquinol methylase
MITTSDAYTTKQDWDAYYVDHHPKKIESVFLAEIFDKYLRPDSEKSVLEVGCAGGEYLCFMARRFGFKVSGIDYSDEIVRTANLFKFNDLPAPELFKQDFFQWQPGRTFDVVYSIGFIEHFEDPARVLRKHSDLLPPGGRLIVTMLHFAHLQYLFHWLIDRENLRKHNTKIMRLPVLRKAIQGLPLRVDHLDYFETFGFWTERKTWKPWQKSIRWTIETFGKVAWKLLGFRRSNFLFSPHIVLVATRI